MSTESVPFYSDVQGVKKQVGTAVIDPDEGSVMITVTDPETRLILQGTQRNSFSIEQHRERE